MNRRNLAERVAKNMNISENKARAFINALVDEMKSSLKEDETICLSSFGTFSKCERKARVGRNVKTKEKIDIPARTVIVFKASKSFTNALTNPNENQNQGERMITITKGE